jgi:isoleucyl-tRNA synthetase
LDYILWFYPYTSSSSSSSYPPWQVCSDPLQYASLQAEPDWQALGSRLGKEMGRVAGGIKALTSQQILEYEATKRAEVAGHALGEGDIKVGV